MWCVGELNIPHERIDAGFLYGLVDTPNYQSINPNGTIPTIQDGDNPPLWETGAILRYLAAQYASDEFWPTNPIDRANIDKWAEWSKLNIALKYTTPVFWRVVRTPPSQRDDDAINLAIRALDTFLATADAQLKNTKFLAGDHFTLADIQFGHCLYRYYDLDVERTKHTNLHRYYTELTKRHAYQEHVMISYEELRETD